MTEDKKKNKPQIVVTLEPEMHKRFRKQAKSRGLTGAAWLRMLGLQDIARNDF